MNYFSEFSMLQDALMMPHFFVRLHFHWSNELVCASKLTAVVMDIYKNELYSFPNKGKVKVNK
jgi:hypothetical protein